MKHLFALGLLLLASACTPYHLISPGTVEFIGKDSTTRTDIAWNAHNSDSQYTWTQDGPALQNLVFHLAVEDGKTLTKSLDVEDKFDPLMVLIGKVPDEVSYRFQRTMTEPEIQDLFTASFGKIVDAPVTATNLHPSTLGGAPGFRFDYAFTGKDGVKRVGIAVGAVVDSKLSLIHYFGTELHHFQKHRDDAEKVIAAFQFKKKS